MLFLLCMVIIRMNNLINLWISSTQNRINKKRQVSIVLDNLIIKNLKSRFWTCFLFQSGFFLGNSKGQVGQQGGVKARLHVVHSLQELQFVVLIFRGDLADVLDRLQVTDGLGLQLHGMKERNINVNVAGDDNIPY